MSLANKFASKVGEEVFLTEEDLVVMKLNGLDWHVDCSSYWNTAPHVVIDIIYNTTNLFRSATPLEVVNKYPMLTDAWDEKHDYAVPVVKIVLIHDCGWELYPSELFYVRL